MAAYATNINQIYFFTSDNASNMMKLYRTVKEAQEDEHISKDDNPEEQNVDEAASNMLETEVESDHESIRLDMPDDLDEEIIDKENATDAKYQKVVKDLYTEEETTALLDECEICSSGLKVKGIHCAVHTLHIALNDSTSVHKSLIAKAQIAAVQFRVENTLRKVRSI